MIEIFHSLKFWKFMNELGETFSIGESGINPLGILPVPQKIWPNDSEEFFFPAYGYNKSIALRNEL